MRFVYNGDVRYISLLGYFYVSDSTVYKLKQLIICTFADVLTAATLYGAQAQFISNLARCYRL